MEQDNGFINEFKVLDKSEKAFYFFLIGKMGVGQCGKIKEECEKDCLSRW